MLKFNKEKIQAIANWLDEVNYRMVCACILHHAQLPVNCCFPDFNKVNAIIRQENPMYGFIFAFFRLGHSAVPIYIRKFIPEEIFQALVDTELAVRNKDNTYKMNHLALLPLNDIYLLSGLPIRYPTSDIDKTFFSHFSDEHYLFLNMMPRHFEGHNALELYATHGAFGLQCAKNGLETIIHPLDEKYQSILRFNMHLNRLENKIQLDNISNIKFQEKKFDFICCRFPSFCDMLNENDYLYTNNSHIVKLYLDAFENLLPNLLSSTGTFQCLLQSAGNQYNISFNDNTLAPWGSKNDMNLLVNVLYKELLTFKLGG